MRTMGSFLRFLGFTICCFLPVILIAQTGEEVIATVNSKKISRSELAKYGSSKLLQMRYQMYLAEQKALDQMIDEQVLADEAASQHLTIDELIARNVTAKIAEPTEDQLRLYYDDLGLKEPFDEVRSKIADHVRQARSAKLRTAYIEQLRAKANIVTTLAPPRADVATGDAPRIGPASTPVKVVEFADYECPYCQKVNAHLAKLRQEFGDQISIYFKDFPLPMHARAQKSAEAARCARLEDKFWQYHDVLFEERQHEPEQLKSYARRLSLNGEKFDRCLDKGEQAETVKKDLAEAQQLGLTGTPSFFINGIFVSGAVEYSTLRDIVRQQLKFAGSVAQTSLGSGN